MNANHHDLDKLLDYVRSNYYCDPNLKRPSIRWTKDLVTGYLGVFNYYNNSIEISSALNDPSVDEQTVMYAVHHENIHQTHSEHDAAFKKLEHLFPNYEKCSIGLDERADTVHDTIEYITNYNNFTKGKKRVVYILLERYGEDYPYAFQSRNFHMIVDCKCKSDFATTEADLFVFLVQLKDNMAIIVGWSENGQLLSKRVVKKYHKYGDEDFSYQFVSKYGSIHVLFPVATSYKIPLDAFPPNFTKDNICVFNTDDESVASDLDYIDSYCEGFLSIGFDEAQIDAIPQFKESVTSKEILSLIRREKDTFRKVWMWNALCAIEPTGKNLLGRAMDKKAGWLLSSALDDLKQIYINTATPSTRLVEEMIKLYTVLDQVESAKLLFEKHFESNYISDDTALNNCIRLLRE